MINLQNLTGYHPIVGSLFLYSRNTGAVFAGLSSKLFSAYGSPLSNCPALIPEIAIVDRDLLLLILNGVSSYYGTPNLSPDHIDRLKQQDYSVIYEGGSPDLALVCLSALSNQLGKMIRLLTISVLINGLKVRVPVEFFKGVPSVLAEYIENITLYKVVVDRDEDGKLVLKGKSALQTS